MEAAAKVTRIGTASTKVLTLTISGIADAFAMAHTVDGMALQAACIAAGFAIPGSIALTTYTRGRAGSA